MQQGGCSRVVAGWLQGGGCTDLVRGQLALDEHVREWYSALSASLPSPLPTPLTCATLADVLATFWYDVSANHRHAGTVAGDVEDPCFAPWAWRALRLRRLSVNGGAPCSLSSRLKVGSGGALCRI